MWAQRRDFGSGNHLGYHNPEAFTVIDSLQATADPDEIDRLYRRLTEIYRADMPFTRLIPWSRDWFVHRRIQGLSTPFRADPDTYMEELWIEDPETTVSGLSGDAVGASPGWMDESLAAP